MPRSPRGPAPDGRRLAWLAAVSGACGLVYESLWMRSLGLVFGNTTDAVAVALAVFMGGLALGSLLAARRRAAAPLRAYARVELAIGATAVATLPLLRALPLLYAALAGGSSPDGPLETAGRIAAAALVLLPTTALLGATVPLLVEALSRAGRGLPESLGRLYLANTLGGAAGVFVGTFVLVPELGLRATLVTAALGNVIVGAIARRWSREAVEEPPAAGVPSRSSPLFVGALAAATGVFTFGVEVLWTRSLALVVGSSVYAFNLMLLAVLIGLVAGTALYQRLRPRLARPALVLGAVVAGAGGAVLVSVVVIGALPAAFLALMTVLPVSFAAYQAAALGLCLVTMLPVTMAMGLTFPLMSHLVESESGSAQQASGWLYACNTAGAVAGALATDLVLVERFGLQRSFVVLAAIPLAAGAWTLARLSVRAPALRALAAAAPCVVLAAISPWWSPWDPAVMTAGVYRYGPEWRERAGFRLGDLAAERTQLFYREGREAVVAVSERAGTSRRFLSINGKTDAGSAPEDVLTQRFIAHVPLLLHPGPRRALVIGWGAGATAAAAALYPLERLECVEIEPATYEAAPLFEDLSGRVRRDPRFRIVFRDGRNHLLRAPEPWDVIVSEPSNPWISGVANLFTREFYEIARRRLAPGGVFGQWFHYYNMEWDDVKVELATFADAFPNVSVWLVPPLPAEAGGSLTADLLLVGSVEPHRLDWPRLQRIFRETPVGADLQATRALRDEMSLVATYGFDRDDLLGLVHGRPGGGAPLAAQHRRPSVDRVPRPAAHRARSGGGGAPGARAVRHAGRDGARPSGRAGRPSGTGRRRARGRRAARGPGAAVVRDGAPGPRAGRARARGRHRARRRSRLGSAGRGRHRRARLGPRRAGPSRAAAAAAARRERDAAAGGGARAAEQVGGVRRRAAPRPRARPRGADRPAPGRLRGGSCAAGRSALKDRAAAVKGTGKEES